MLKRPDPEELLKEIVKLSTGRHKIFLGMAPGVGKTYKMLEEANELRKKGVDIVVGYVEFQNRSENQGLINALEIIPRKAFRINEKEFYDLDLEGVIERKPATVIIDELAHTNISGSLNQKRYQDIQEILKNGISVFSTLNIHQLESIAPFVEKNINIKINETIPDWVLNQADELVVVDISVDELYQRLTTKQIYSQEQLNQGLKYFFKRSNLHLLRDLALNLMAERVDVQVTREKVSAKIKDRILVAVSLKERSIKLIKHAAYLAEIIHADLDIICISKKSDEIIISKIREYTKLHKGNFFLIKETNKNIADEIIHYIKLNRITKVVMGYPKKQKLKSIFNKPALFRIMEKTSNLDILLINENDNSMEMIDQITHKESKTEKVTNSHFGKLKIYIGMAPGVGKTYKMLQDAKELYKQGTNILLGVIDTHGRQETEDLMKDLPSLPFKLIEHKGKYLPEFDLEAGILAKPEIILIDELAHANVQGSINNKRYQDVQYLLRAGINVMSTVNIQHIESLNDIVEQVTGIKVRETVPDWLISHATEIVLIDLSPETLQERLKSGKIYTVDKIEQALTHFFQKKNLIALRELSLREVAESVEHEMYPMKKRTKVLSFIDINTDTLRLIRKSARIANKFQAELIVMHIVKDTNKLIDEQKKGIIELEQLIVELGGDFRLVEGTNITDEVINAITKIKPEYVVLSEPKKNNYTNIFKKSILKNILFKITDPNIWIVGDFTKEISE